MALNEQIRKLAQEAGWSEDIRYAPRLKEIEKFAELIVRECVNAILHDSDRYRKEYFAEVVKKHFGVEE